MPRFNRYSGLPIVTHRRVEHVDDGDAQHSSQDQHQSDESDQNPEKQFDFVDGMHPDVLGRIGPGIRPEIYHL